MGQTIDGILERISASIVRRDIERAINDITRAALIRTEDYHGQLEPTVLTQLTDKMYSWFKTIIPEKYQQKGVQLAEAQGQQPVNVDLAGYGR